MDVEALLNTLVKVMRKLSNEIWNRFDSREDDIIVGSYMKSGTTLLQQMVSQILSKGKEGIEVNKISPWIDCPRIEVQDSALETYKKQKNRRFIKTHLNYEDLPSSEGVKKIYAVRYGIDVAYSTFKHHSNMSESLYIPSGSDIPFPSAPPKVSTAKKYFKEWANNDSKPWWSYFDSAKSVLENRHDPNLMLLRFEDL